MTIWERTKADENVRKLTAASRLYAQSKRWYAFEISIAVPPLVAASILLHVAPHYAVYATFYSVVASLLAATVFETQRSKRRKLAAEIHDDYDRRVLAIVRNPLAIKTPAAPELVHRYSKSASPEWIERARRWYDEVPQDTPEPLARVLCQRHNCIADAQVRSFYRAIILTASVLTILIAAVVVLMAEADAALMLLMIVAPSLPMVLLAIREVRAHNDALQRLAHLSSEIQRWLEAEIAIHDPGRMTALCERLQDEITAHRRDDPPPFDWVYRLYGRLNKGAAASASAELAHSHRLIEEEL